MIAAIILAAGRSQRLGRPKQLLEVAGMTLVERACLLARDAGCEPIVVVTGAFAEAVEHAIEEQSVTIVRNVQYGRGMGSSIATGVDAVAKADGVIVMTVDQLRITSEHLRALRETPERLTGTAYADTIGIPAYFPQHAFAALAQLDGDRGAKQLLASAHGVPFEDASLDVDTLADLERLATAT